MAARAIDIRYEGKTLNLEINLWDMVAWEDYARDNKLPIKPTATDFQPSKYTGYLAFTACKRLNYCPKETGFYEWLAKADIVTDAESEDTDSDDDPSSGPVEPSGV